MRKILLLGAAFVLSTSAFAMSVPVGRHLLADRGGGEGSGAAYAPHFLLASEHGDRRHGERRRYAEDDEDDDDDESGGVTPPRAAGPNAPVPDNGLFNGKARPKVEVQ